MANYALNRLKEENLLPVRREHVKLIYTTHALRENKLLFRVTSVSADEWKAIQNSSFKLFEKGPEPRSEIREEADIMIWERIVVLLKWANCKVILDKSEEIYVMEPPIYGATVYWIKTSPTEAILIIDEF